MKKYIVTSLILSLLSSAAIAAGPTVIKTPEDLETLQNNFYQGPFMPTPEIRYIDPDGDMEYQNEGFGRGKLRSMPLFKQLRIKMTNHYKIKNHEDELKLIEEEKIELQKLQAEEANKNEININDKTIKEKKPKEPFKFRNPLVGPKKNDTSKLPDVKIEDPKTLSNDTPELSGGIKTVLAPKEVQLDCDVMEYFDEREELEATGHPVLTFPNQGMSLKADKIVYHSTANIIKAYDNVEIIRDGSTIYGDFIQINMNEENSFMDKMTTEEMFMTVHARKAYANDDKIILEKGDMVGEHSYKLNMRTQMMGYRSDYMIIDEKDYSRLSDTIGERKIKIIAKDIFVNAKKEHDVITVKKADVYFADKKLFSWPSFTAHTNKGQNYFEANYPELGSRSRIGMYAGPGFVFDTPFASTVKVVPFLNYRSKFGFGAAVKYRSPTNFTDMAYGSAENIFVMRGRQDLDDNLHMQYGVNSYTDDWFMGQRMSKYIAELVYQKGVRAKNFLGKDLDLSFKHRLSGGYVQESDYNTNNEDFKNGEIGTMRLKYMAQIDQTFYHVGDKEKMKYIDLALSMQGAATVYGTGDTQFVGRLGPRIHSQYKYWMQDIGYYMSAYQDGTPTPRFDAYRYGHSNVYLRESIRLTKYLRLAWLGSVNLSNDSPNKELFQENAFIISLGPDDFRLSLGYDFIRGNTYFGVDIAMDTKGTSVVFDKMEIKNPDRLAKKDKPDVKPISFENIPEAAVKKIYAEVIEIEDPDREQM